MKTKWNYVSLAMFRTIALGPYVFLTFEVAKLINPIFVAENMSGELGVFISIYYLSWIVFSGIIYSGSWAISFLAFPLIAKYILFGGASPYASMIPSHLRLDSAISILFILYYIWEFEVPEYVNKLGEIERKYFSKIKPISKLIRWFIGKSILHGFRKQEAKCISMGIDRKKLYILLAKNMQNNGSRVWLVREVNILGFQFKKSEKSGKDFTLILPDQVSISLAENVLSGKVPAENLLLVNNKK